LPDIGLSKKKVTLLSLFARPLYALETRVSHLKD
jgi:hypothetical protein